MARMSKLTLGGAVAILALAGYSVSVTLDRNDKEDALYSATHTVLDCGPVLVKVALPSREAMAWALDHCDMTGKGIGIVANQDIL